MRNNLINLKSKIYLLLSACNSDSMRPSLCHQAHRTDRYRLSEHSFQANPSRQAVLGLNSLQLQISTQKQYLKIPKSACWKLNFASSFGGISLTLGVISRNLHTGYFILKPTVLSGIEPPCAKHILGRKTYIIKLVAFPQGLKTKNTCFLFLTGSTIDMFAANILLHLIWVKTFVSLGTIEVTTRASPCSTRRWINFRRGIERATLSKYTN